MDEVVIVWVAVARTVMAAIESVHPAIEISDTRFTKWASQDRPSQVADQLNHGALIVGEGIADWRDAGCRDGRAALRRNIRCGRYW